ncbi:MAG TPA: hypothetical protein VGR19_12010 [Allosphingosinicella sp.]|nr:hypothetical protein [Allosphingosinicella sp.]
MQKIIIGAAAAGILATAGFSDPAEARRKPRETWEVSRVTDPITGSQTCVVAAYDRAAGMSFTRMGHLYPVVERNPQFGVLVGVSSGGRFRFPTGDILWRVDTNPHREIKAADNPAPASAAPAPATDAASSALQETMALSMRLALAGTATSTLASGERAQEMLREMLSGSGLIFRAAAATPAYGLPSSATGQVGQITRDGLKPIPLDQSFRKGLAECGISAAPPAAP